MSVEQSHERSQAIWWTGVAGSGKSDRLVQTYARWVEEGIDSRTIFVFSASSELRTQLAAQLQMATHNRAIVQAFTPIGFFQREVLLYWPLLQDRLGLLARFPLTIAPENEQELADKLFAKELEAGQMVVEGFNRERIVRHIIDNLQLAASAGLSVPAIGERLLQARGDEGSIRADVLTKVGELAERFRSALLNQGLLTYSLMTELYGQHLLPNRLYRQQLLQRCRWAIADDVDEYPALMGALFELLLQEGVSCQFSFNVEGAVRLGYGADPVALESLSRFCTVKSLESTQGLESECAAMLAVLADPAAAWDVVAAPLANLQLLQTATRRELLRTVADVAIAAVANGDVRAEDMAIVGPGLDPVGVYTLRTLLEAADLPVRLLDNSRPLQASPLMRALLTLVALVYPDCGQLLSPEHIAEMLVVVSDRQIDPVRAGLLSDSCFLPQADRPQLLNVGADPRRDRLGAKASAAYQPIARWVQHQQHAALQPLPQFLQAALRQFWLEQNLDRSQVSTYRAATEAAQRYEAVAQRLGQSPETIGRSFYELLASGAVTAKPDVNDLDAQSQSGIVLGTIYQYRMARLSHRWQFWLDAGSSLWNSAYSSFGSFQLKNPYLFLESWNGEIWSPERTQEVLDEGLERVLADLTHRCRDRIILCHSDLSIAGSELTGPLLPIVDRASLWSPASEPVASSAE
ncbi:MAG: recombinase family protein [Cyanobacteria bacterium J06597_1]